MSSATAPLAKSEDDFHGRRQPQPYIVSCQISFDPGFPVCSKTGFAAGFDARFSICFETGFAPSAFQV